MKKIIFLLLVAILFTGSTTGISDEGFKAKINFNKSYFFELNEYVVQQKLKNANYSTSEAIQYKTDKKKVRSPVSINRECYFFISEPYAYTADSTYITDFDKAPKFAGGEEDKFCKWIKKNYEFTYNQLFVRDAGNGYFLFNITIDNYGDIADIKLYNINNAEIDLDAYNSIFDLLEKSPSWTPAEVNGKIIQANYVIAFAWADHIIIDIENKYYKQALEEGWDPLYILLD